MSVRKRTWTTGKGEKREAWVVDYFDAEGTRRLKTFPRQKDARDWRDRLGVELQDGVHVPERASRSVGEAGKKWLASCIANGLERSTTAAYRNHLDLHIAPFLGDKLLTKITVPVVRAFEDKLREEGRSPAMVKRVLSSLGAIIADAMERGEAAHNAVREMKQGRGAKKRRQEQRHAETLEIGKDIPTPAEIKAFLAAGEPKWKPVLMTAAFSGLRASELRGLRWSDVDLSALEIHVRQRADRFNAIGSPKSKGSRRMVKIGPALAQVLREWKLVCPRRETGEVDEAGNKVKVLDFVFPNGAGKIESHANLVNRALIPAMIAAGVTLPGEGVDEAGKPKLKAKFTGLHCLRHFYASWCINPVAAGGMGLTLKEVQQRMGHASIQMTSDRYGHLFPRTDEGAEIEAAERALLG